MDKINTDEVRDFVMVYCQSDKAKAIELKDRIQSISKEFKGRLFDGLTNNGDVLKYCDDPDAIQSALVHNSVWKLFVVSNNCGNAAEMKDFKYWKSELTSKRIYRGSDVMVPIWLTPKNKLTRSAEKNLYGLMSLTGLDPGMSQFDEHIRRLMSSDTHDEIKERLIADVENEAEISGTSRTTVSQTIDPNGTCITNIYNTIIADNSAKITQNAPPTSAHMRTTIDQDEHFHAPEAFWREFAGDGDYVFVHDGITSMSSQSSPSESYSLMTAESEYDRHASVMVCN